MEKITADDVHGMLQKHFEKHSDVGFWKSMTTVVLEPQNPFAPPVRRQPRRWFVISFICSFAGLAAFIYFNLWN